MIALAALGCRVSYGPSIALGGGRGEPMSTNKEQLHRLIDALDDKPYTLAEQAYVAASLDEYRKAGGISLKALED